MTDTFYLAVERPELAYFLSKGMPTTLRTLDPCLIDFVPETYYSKYNEKPEDLLLSYSISKEIQNIFNFADKLTKDFEYELCETLELVPDKSLSPNLQQFGLSNILGQIDIYNRIAEQIPSQIGQRCVIIPVLFEPARDYRPSWIPSTTLISTLGQFGILTKPEFFSLTRTEPRLYPDYLANYEFPKNGFNIIFGNGLHNDVDFITSNIDVKRTIQLRSGEWDTSFNQLPQAPFISAEGLLKRFKEQSPEHVSALTSIINRFLNRIFQTTRLNKFVIEGQVEATTQRYLEQLALYDTLNKSSWPRPDMIIAGMHPALAVTPTLHFYAQQKVSEIFHFPHSKLINQRLAINYGKPLSHACNANETVNKAINPEMGHVKIVYPDAREISLRETVALSTIGILFNKLSGDGYLITDINAVKDFYLRLKEIALNRRVELSVRDKPYGTCTRVLSATLGIDIGALYADTSRDLDEYISTCDLVLMIDSPTTASFSALKLGVPIIHVSLRALHDSEAALLPSCIPTWSTDDCLTNIAQFSTDHNTLVSLKRTQQHAYLSKVSSGKSLKSILSHSCRPDNL
jgi:hypothetical protein